MLTLNPTQSIRFVLLVAAFAIAFGAASADAQIAQSAWNEANANEETMPQKFDLSVDANQSASLLSVRANTDSKTSTITSEIISQSNKPIDNTSAVNLSTLEFAVADLGVSIAQLPLSSKKTAFKFSALR